MKILKTIFPVSSSHSMMYVAEVEMFFLCLSSIVIVHPVLTSKNR